MTSACGYLSVTAQQKWKAPWGRDAEPTFLLLSFEQPEVSSAFPGFLWYTSYICDTILLPPAARGSFLGMLPLEDVVFSLLTPLLS